MPLFRKRVDLAFGLLKVDINTQWSFCEKENFKKEKKNSEISILALS